MREKFEKDEKIALRSSKTYKVIRKIHRDKFELISVIISLTSLLHIGYIYIRFSQSIHKLKREKALEITDLAKQGGGESYIDSSRGIAVGMGNFQMKY